MDTGIICGTGSNALPGVDTFVNDGTDDTDTATDVDGKADVDGGAAPTYIIKSFCM